MNLGGLFVEIMGDDRPLRAKLEGVRGSLAGFKVPSLNLGGMLGAVGAVAVGTAGAVTAIGAALYKSVNGASDLAESLSKVSVVFGDSTSKITGTADELAKAFGLPKREILDAASNIGLVAKGAGQSADQAADLGSAMAKLAADAASFYNVPLDLALEKIRAGLVGESEPLRAFGVLLSDDAMKAEALRLGLMRAGQDMTDAAKVQARASLITKGLADASGDLARTQDGAANQSRKFSGQLQNLSDTIGTILLPAFGEILSQINKVVTGSANAFDGMKKDTESFAKKLKEDVKVVGFSLENLGTSWNLIAIDTEIAITKMTSVFDPLISKYNQLLNLIRENPLWGQTGQVDMKRWGENAVSSLVEGLRTGKVPNLAEMLLPKEIKDSGKLFDPKTEPSKHLENLEKERTQIVASMITGTLRNLIPGFSGGGKKPDGPSSGSGGDDGKDKKPDYELEDRKRDTKSDELKRRETKFTDLESFAKQLQIGALSKADVAAEKTATNTGLLLKKTITLIEAVKSKPLEPGVMTA